MYQCLNLITAAVSLVTSMSIQEDHGRPKIAAPSSCLQGSRQLHLAYHIDVHTVTLRWNAASLAHGVEPKRAAALACRVEVTSLRPVRVAYLRDDICPATSPVASLSRTDCLSSLHTVGCSCTHGLEGKRARLVLVRERVGSRPRRAQGDSDPVLELVRRLLARPQLDLCPIETLVAVDNKAHLCGGVPRLDLSDIIEVPGLVLVAVAASPKLNFRSILILVAVDHDAVF